MAAPLASSEQVVLHLPLDAPDWFRAYHDQLLQTMQRNQQRVDQGQGLRSRPSISAPLQAYAQPIENVGDAVQAGDALNRRSGQRLIGTAVVDSIDALLAAANMWADVNQFAAGISFNDETLSVYDEGTFTATLTGMTTSVTGTARHVRVGKAVCLFLPTLSGTSNATTAQVTGLPAIIQPTQTSWQVVRITDNSLDAFGVVRFNSASGTLDVFPSFTAGAWTATGTKTLYATMLAYHLV